MSWSHWIRTHKRSLLFLVGVLIVGGLATGLRMPVALFPTVEFPRVVVNIESGDQPAERMAFEVTYPIENAVRAVNGVRSVRSTTSRGSADVSVNFNWGEDMVSAKLQVEAALAQALPDLPQGTRFTVRRMDPNVFPVIGYTLTSPIRDQVFLRDLAYYEIRPQLQTVAGVASVEVLGGDQEEYRVTVDPAQLAAHRLTVESVRATLEASNVVSAVGRLEDEYKLYLLVAGAQMRDIADVGDAVLKGGTGGVVRLKDIATVSKSTVPQWIRVSADGEPAVIVQVYQQPSGSTVQIAGDIRASLANISAKLPPDVRLSNWYDQSELILAATNSVRDAVLIGVLLAAFVLWIFLRNARVTLVAIVMVPAVLAAATLLLRVFGMSFNLMTLGGMAAAVGLVIDDAI
ncbi:MAG: efflux RND transporter permease subunit, partial [Bacteroidetes bacterium]|nr:efflux RND transporter permease subunit [Bacteroidota bacterium]